MNRIPYLPEYSDRSARKSFVEREFLAISFPTKISVIKILRAMTDAGLKDAKEMTEESLFFPTGLEFYFPKTDENMKKVAAFFDYNEQDAAKELHRALSLLKDHWETLGFSSYKEAVETICRNF